MKVYLCVHRSALQIKNYEEFPIKTKEKWRIRDLKEHPRDPGWERSRYCRCHKGMRNSKKITNNYQEEEIYVLDTVKIQSKKHVIRSMFLITDIKPCKIDNSTDLLFKDYYFAPKDMSKISYVQEFGRLANFNGIRNTKLLDENISKRIIKKIKKTYEHVAKGEKPSTVESKDWRFYDKRQGLQHVCK